MNGLISLVVGAMQRVVTPCTRESADFEGTEDGMPALLVDVLRNFAHLAGKMDR